MATGLRPSPHHAERIPGESKTLRDRERGIYEYTNLVVLKWAAMPAALLECGVLVHREEELELSQPERQQRTIAAIMRAVTEFARTRPPPSPTGERITTTLASDPAPAAATKPSPAARPTIRPTPPLPPGTLTARPRATPGAPTEPVADLPRSVVPARTIPLASPPPVVLPPPTPTPVR